MQTACIGHNWEAVILMLQMYLYTCTRTLVLVLLILASNDLKHNDF